MSTRNFLIALILIGVLLRAGLWVCYEPVSFPDTGTYIAAARDLINGDVRQAEGRRPPGYPALVAVIGEAPQKIFVVHLFSGLLISVFLFQIALQMSGRPGVAFVVGMTYNLNLQQLFLEGAFLTETVSTLSVVAVVATALSAFRQLQQGKRSIGLLLLLGILAGVAVLVRPQYVFVPLLLPLLAVYAVSGLRMPSMNAVNCASLVAVPAIVLVLGWCAFLYAKIGHFTLSTQSGFGLVNHSVAFVEHAPERYAAIRDVLLKHRAQRAAASGHYGNTVWYAWPEIKAATGLSLPEASRELQKMSFELFARHPLLYGTSVAHAWKDFWTVPIFWELSKITPAWLRSPLDNAWWVEHKLLRGVNLVFVLLVLVLLVSPGLRRRTRWDLALTTIAALILGSSLIQALADQGASSRYAVTIQSLVVLVVIVAWARFRDIHEQASRHPATHASRR